MDGRAHLIQNLTGELIVFHVSVCVCPLLLILTKRRMDRWPCMLGSTLTGKPIVCRVNVCVLCCRGPQARDELARLIQPAQVSRLSVMPVPSQSFA